MTMFAHERRQQILTLTRREGRVNVSDLATDLGVTSETIRRDLSELETRGLLRRVHGGAIPIDHVTLEPEVAQRARSMTAEKERIGRRALEELPVEGTVYVDAGTTTSALIEALPSDHTLRVVTNSIPIALTAAGMPGVTVLALGGQVRPRTLATVGPWAIRRLTDLHVDVVFLATNGISVRRGLTTPNTEEAALKQLAAQSGDRVVLLADHTKVGQERLERFAGLDAIDLFITDTGVSSEDRRALEGEGVPVVTV